VIRAVIDPGVLIAGLITPGGLPSNMIRTWKQGLFEIVVSPLLIDELTATLLRPKFRRWASENDAVAFVEVLRLSAVMAEDPAEIEPVSRDPNDDYLIALAREARAHVLVSGDGDLTSLVSIDPPIVSPRLFLAGLERG